MNNVSICQKPDREGGLLFTQAMSDTGKQTQPSASRQIADDSIRRFLLGQLTAGEQTDFEERLFTDAELETRVRLAEFELSDEYVGAGLGQAEGELFRRRFLRTFERRQKLEVSRALQDRFAPQTTMTFSASRGQRLRTFFDLKQPGWRYAFAAVILILLFATVLLVTKRPQIVKRLVMPGRIPPRSKVTPTPQFMHHPGSQSAPVHVEQSPAMPAHEAPALTVTLNPNDGIDQAPVVSLAGDDESLIRFQLVIQTDRSSSYQADLFTISGELVFRAGSLKPSDTNPSAIYFDVPGKSLKPGQYRITLSRTGDSTMKSVDYYFNAH